MKKTVRLVVLAALLLSLSSFGLAGAQTSVDGVDAALTYTSGFTVQNLEDALAQVQLEFYRQDGTKVDPVANADIAANSSKSFFPIEAVPQGFDGSLVISSDRDVRAVSNLLGSGAGDYFAATNGFQAGANSVSLPLIMCSNSGFDTFFNVQNAGSADAHITIQYVPGPNGVAQSETATIKPGAAKRFSQALGSSTVNCSTLKDGAGKFIGSAQITSDQPVVAAVMQLNTTTWKVLMGYGGFTDGSPEVALPLVMANNSGFYTSIQVQNVGAAATTVNIDYSQNTAGSGAPADESFTLGVGEMKSIIQNSTPAANGGVNDWGAIGRYVGSAHVTNTGGQKLVAIVNQVSPMLGAAYESFDPAAATTKASAPLIMANNNTYYTSIQVQNVSGGNVSVTIDYGPNTVGSFDPANEQFTLAAGEMKAIIQNSTPAANGGVNNWGANRYVGSAVVTATGNIVAVINQISQSKAGDQLASTDAFNLAPMIAQ